MSAIALVRAADLKPTLLKSGDGATATIAIFPHDAQIQSFEWRISLATMWSAGAFSHFAGIDRKLGIVSGGIDLDMQGAEPLSLHTAAQPLAFPGEQRVFGRPTSDAVSVLNVMVRRDLWASTLELIAPGQDWTPPASAQSTALVATSAATLTHGGKEWVIGPADTVLLHGATHQSFRIEGAPTYCATCSPRRSVARDRPE